MRRKKAENRNYSSPTCYLLSKRPWQRSTAISVRKKRMTARIVRVLCLPRSIPFSESNIGCVLWYCRLSSVHFRSTENLSMMTNCVLEKQPIFCSKLHKRPSGHSFFKKGKVGCHSADWEGWVALVIFRFRRVTISRRRCSSFPPSVCCVRNCCGASHRKDSCVHVIHFGCFHGVLYGLAVIANELEILSDTDEG